MPKNKKSRGWIANPSVDISVGAGYRKETAEIQAKTLLIVRV
jgi:hypothetical protein